ncbi:heat shock factor 2-binding protein [Periophthalmus magnuspinnatus]|uniref:heat shock factor 2-binding protein n=1 Tax=Periophthalmus magnuspinnatus TaxID=409849 RepID=UPI0024373F89|nr:heat shock factor 2-binding protein [Periophthalmus magnuspinnatus]
MLGGKSVNSADKEGYVRVRKRELDKLTTEVMQLRDFLPKVLNGELMEMLNKAKAAQTMREQMAQEQERLRQDCAHLQSRLEASQAECQKEREEKLLLREQLWQSGTELQQQADFCSSLGSASCCLLWSCSAKEDIITLWLSDHVKLQSFLLVAAQTLESFVCSLDEDVKVQTEDPNSQEHTFVLALAGTITNIAANTNGRDFLANFAHVLLDTLIRLLELMRAGAFPKLKVLMLMALYNVSISIKGLKYMMKNPGLLSVTLNLLQDRDWEVCLHSLRLLQSLVLEDEALLVLGPAVVDPELEVRVKKLTSSVQPCVREAAQQTLEDLQAAFKKSKASKR